MIERGHRPPRSLRLKDFPPKIRGEKMLTCRLCGAFYTRIRQRFSSGSVEPTVGETLTGASSGDTGVVVETVLESGTYAGGDAVGEVYLSSETGVDDNGDWGEDGEELNGSIGGASMMTTDGSGIQQKFGQQYPLSWMSRWRGVWYCRPHAKFMQESHALKYEIEIDVGEMESSRGELPD